MIDFSKLTRVDLKEIPKEQQISEIAHKLLENKNNILELFFQAFLVSHARSEETLVALFESAHLEITYLNDFGLNARIVFDRDTDVKI